MRFYQINLYPGSFIPNGRFGREKSQSIAKTVRKTLCAFACLCAFAGNKTTTITLYINNEKAITI
jgi:hypothetical protein